MRCHWCGAVLRYEQGRGWLHPGGSLYVARCDNCGWRTDERPTPRKCPRCGEMMRDDHCARPVPEEGGVQ